MKLFFFPRSWFTQSNISNSFKNKNKNIQAKWFEKNCFNWFILQFFFFVSLSKKWEYVLTPTHPPGMPSCPLIVISRALHGAILFVETGRNYSVRQLGMGGRGRREWVKERPNRVVIMSLTAPPHPPTSSPPISSQFFSSPSMEYECAGMLKREDPLINDRMRTKRD